MTSTSRQQVPFYGLGDEWSGLKDEALLQISKVFDHGKFVGGPEIVALEGRISKQLGASHVKACSSGTTALLIAMMALNIGPGDEVIIPAFTFAAPVECALLLGATPVLVDVDYPSGLIDLTSARNAITGKTKAIVAVSLFGLMPDFGVLSDLAREFEIEIIEDAAQSYGAQQDGRASGSFGRVSCLSFFPTKVLGGAGDGGAITTSDQELAEKIRHIRDHGQDGRFSHVCLGLNGRMSSIAAAALLVRHSYLEAALKRRREIGDFYDTQLAGLKDQTQIGFSFVPEGMIAARSQYAVVVSGRDRVREDLLKSGVQTAVYYPRPLHFQPAFRNLPRGKSLANSERLASNVICLPIHPALDLQAAEFVMEMLTQSV